MDKVMAQALPETTMKLRNKSTSSISPLRSTMCRNTLSAKTGSKSPVSKIGFRDSAAVAPGHAGARGYSEN